MDNTKLNTVAEATLTGTAKNSRRGNIRLRSSSVEHAPMTRLPPDENGEIAELWAPTTIQVYKINGFRPAASESLMKMMGAEILFLTNASGAVNYDFHVGDFMMITDQISNFVPSPLIGPNIEELGERFCDMSQIYNHDLCRILRETAEELGVHLQEGTYIQLTGPNYETPKEVKMCRILGADAVGMSTACEAVAANHMGMKICGISCISNLGCGMSEQPLSHEEVKETADRVAPLFKKLITASITRMGRM